jgi:pimeloyl-ACP methyl ester carboxylesterase
LDAASAPSFADLANIGAGCDSRRCVCHSARVTAPRPPTDPPDDRPTFPLANLLELDDRTVAEWEAIGEGSPLLWIEGGPGLPAHLARPDVALLADRFRCHLVNAPGCGRSSPPAAPESWGLDSHVRYFDAVRRALGLDQVTLMGHSWGGLVALALALHAPDAVDRVIVIDGYAGQASVPEDVAAAEAERALDRVRGEPWFESAWSVFGTDHPTARDLDDAFARCWPLYFAEPDSPAARAHIERLGRETRWNIEVVRAWEPEPPIDLRPDLARLRQPVLVLVGEHDFICGPAWARAIVDATPTATYHQFPGVGHVPQYEAPDAFRRVIGTWLESLGAVSADRSPR